MSTPPVRLVVVGCCAEKVNTATPVAALDLYQGWCFPPLRARTQGRPPLRSSILILSGKHGLIRADTPLLPYDQPLTPSQADTLRDGVRQALDELLRSRRGYEMLLLLAPEYLELLAPGLLAHPPAVAHWIAEPNRHWQIADAVLTGWGWPTSGRDGSVR